MNNSYVHVQFRDRIRNSVKFCKYWTCNLIMEEQASEVKVNLLKALILY